MTVWPPPSPEELGDGLDSTCIIDYDGAAASPFSGLLKIPRVFMLPGYT
jgi:hypothetical protein